MSPLNTETVPTRNRGSVDLCASTREKLKGFTCSAEPGVARRGEVKTDGASSSRICCDGGGGAGGEGGGSGDGARPPRDGTDQSGNEISLQHPEDELEEEDENEDEEVKDEESSGMAEQVPDV